MTDIKFNKFFRLCNQISILLIIISVVLLVFKGLNFGVDFKGGTLIEIRVDKNSADISKIRNIF